MSDRHRPASVHQLRVVKEFRADEEPRIRELFRKLDRRLGRFDAGQVDMELSVKERHTASQSVVLECWIAGWPRLVATSREADLDRALTEVRHDLWRQLDDAIRRRIEQGRR